MIISSINRRVNASEWVDAIAQAYVANNITASPPDPTSECLTGACPTERDWCFHDPNCSESPYQEPRASVKPGVIAGFTVAGVLLQLGIVYMVHRWLVARQASRYRAAFANRIAQTISVQKSMRSLTPELLANEFRKIDSGTPDGKIDKEELWEFLSTGKAGDINTSDFNALFAAIDTDRSGTVDFVEFCSFMGQCHDEYVHARANRGSIHEKRMSVSTNAARRISSVAYDAEAAAAAVREEEEEEEHD